MSKYSNKFAIQCAITSISIDKSQIKGLEDYMRSRSESISSDLSIDIIQPSLVKEIEYPIVNDRLFITILVSSSEKLSDESIEEFKLKIKEVITEYLSLRDILFNIKILTSFKL